MKKLDFGQLSRLESLTIDTNCVPNAMLFPATLRYLEIIFYYDTVSSTEQAINSSAGLPVLSSLTVRGCPSSAQVRNGVWPIIAAAGSLRLLSMCGQVDCKMRDMMNLVPIQTLGKLETFYHPGGNLQDEDLEKLAAYCPCIRDIDVSESGDITGVGLKALVARTGSGVRRINLTKCSGVGMDAIQWARNKGVNVVWSNPNSQTRRKSAKAVQYTSA